MVKIVPKSINPEAERKEVTIKGRGIITEEQAAIYYPGYSYSDVKKATESNIRAQAIREAKKKGAKLDYYETPEGELVAAPKSMKIKETYEKVAQRREEQKLQAIKEREEKDYRAAQEQADKEYIESVRKYENEKLRYETAQEIGRNPVVRTSYVLSPQEWFGFGVLSEVAVSGLTGQDWNKKRDDMMTSYAYGLMERKDQTVKVWGGALSGGKYVDVTVPAEYSAAAESAGFAGAKAGLMAASGGTSQVAQATGFSLKAMLGAGIGYQAGTTIKDYTSGGVLGRMRTGENIARTFVYSTPFIAGAAAKGPKLKIETIKINENVKYRGVTFEYGSGDRAVGVAGIQEGKVVTGTPKIDVTKTDFGTKGYTPETPFQTKVIIKSLETGRPKAAEMVKSFVEGSKQTEMQTSAVKRSLSAEGTKTLSSEGVKNVVRFASKERGTLYGSYTAEPQLPKGRLGRKAGDIDISIMKSSKELGPKVDILVKQLERTEGKRNVRRSDLLIETRDKYRKWHHAVDIHSKDTLAKDMMSPGVEAGFGFKFNQRTTMLKSSFSKPVEAMRLSEFGVRKGSSSSTLRNVGKDYDYGLGPEPHRMKDIGDYITAQKFLIESRRGGFWSRTGLKSAGTKKAERALVKYKKGAKDMFGIEGSEKIKLMAYEPPKPSRSAPYISPSLSTSLPSVGSVASWSVSRSRSPSRSRSRSRSPSLSMSPSLSPSISPSLSPSISPSISPSPSPSLSPSISPSPSPSPSPPPGFPPPPPPPGLIPPPPGRGRTKSVTIKGKKGKKPTYKYAPSLGGIIGVVKPVKKAPKVTAGARIRPIVKL